MILALAPESKPFELFLILNLVCHKRDRVMIFSIKIMWYDVRKEEKRDLYMNLREKEDPY